MEAVDQKLIPSLPDIPMEDPPWDPIEPWHSYQLQDHGGIGVVSQYGGNQFVNYEAYAFMEAMFKKFNRGRLPCTELLEWAWDFAFQAIDQVDPYLFFHGATDVIKTDEPYYYQFSIRYDDEEPWEDVSGEEAEHFKYWKEGEKVFFYLLDKPGLQEYFDGIYDYFSDHMAYAMEAMNDGYDSYYLEETLHKRYGDSFVHLAHLGVWSALMWMISPEAKSWRYDHHPIFRNVYSGGECLLNGWNFHSPQYFKKAERPVGSCAECGVKDWCVELVQDDEMNIKYTCQHCQTGGDPFPGAICGTKMCSRLECEHHPDHVHARSMVGSRIKREIQAEARYGKLQKHNGVYTRELPGMIHLEHKVIQHYSKSIASDVGRVLEGLLSPPK